MSRNVEISSYVKKPVTRRSSSIADSAERRQTASNVLPSVPKASVNRRPAITNVSTNTSVRPASTTSHLNNVTRPSSIQETPTDQLLRDELKRMRTSFEVFRKECYNRMESVLKTNASLVEDIGDLKKQLHMVSGRAIGLSARGAKKSPVSIDTDKLLTELSTKLLESPEFKDSVLAIIAEHEVQVAEDKKEEETLLKPPLFRQSFGNYSGCKLTPTSRSKRPTTIRDESYVIASNYDDEVEIIEEHGIDPLLSHVKNEPKHPESRTPASDASLATYSESDLSEEDEIIEAINQTFTISDDESENSRRFTGKENSPAVFNRPTINSRRLSAATVSFAQTKPTHSAKSPITQHPMCRRNTMYER